MDTEDAGLSSNCYTINTAQSERGDVAGGASLQGGVDGAGPRSRRRGIPVAPLKLEGDNSLLSKAFTNVSTKVTTISVILHLALDRVGGICPATAIISDGKLSASLIAVLSNREPIGLEV